MMNETLLSIIVCYILITGIFFAAYLLYKYSDDSDFDNVIMILAGFLIGWILIPIKVAIKIWEIAKNEFRDEQEKRV